MVENLLIVDDQFGIRLLLTEIFKKDGYQVFQAKNGKEALNIIKKHRIGLILLDIKLPDIDGLEVFNIALSNGYEKHVITMSAYTDSDMISESNRLGARYHMHKPFDIDELREAVKEAFNFK
jgi:two-component system, response regulator, stage 0 sporulation protein F